MAVFRTTENSVLRADGKHPVCNSHWRQGLESGGVGVSMPIESNIAKVTTVFCVITKLIGLGLGPRLVRAMSVWWTSKFLKINAHAMQALSL
jgi:hypothetical protein